MGNRNSFTELKKCACGIIEGRGLGRGEMAIVKHDEYEVIFGKQHAGMASSQITTTRRLANSLILLTYALLCKLESLTFETSLG